MRKMMLYYFILNAIITWSCNLVQHQEARQQQPVVIDTSISEQTSFNNLFIDTTHIDTFLAKHPEYRQFQQQYADFYKQRNYECAWFDSSGISEQAYNFMNLLNTATNTYNDSSLYNKELTKDMDAFKKDTTNIVIQKVPDIAETELMLTG